MAGGDGAAGERAGGGGGTDAAEGAAHAADGHAIAASGPRGGDVTPSRSGDGETGHLPGPMQRIFGRAASRGPRSSGSSSSGARRSSSTERDSRAQRTERVGVVMPAGVRPGMEVQFENPRTGRYFKAAVPPGLLPGQTFIVNVLRSRESSPARGRDVVPVEVSFPSAAASPGRSATSPAQQGGASERERREAAELAEAVAASLAAGRLSFLSAFLHMECKILAGGWSTREEELGEGSSRNTITDPPASRKAEAGGPHRGGLGSAVGGGEG